MADLAVMALGGVAVRLGLASTPERVAEVGKHCAATMAIVDGDHQPLDAAQVTSFQHLVVIDGAARRPSLGFAEVLARGRAADDAEYFAAVEALRPEALAQLTYTPRGAGELQGVMITHHNLCWAATNFAQAQPMTAEDLVLVPPSHLAQRGWLLSGPVMTGAQVAFAESLERLPQDTTELRPTLVFGAPQVWEVFKRQAEVAIAALPAARRRLLARARGVAMRFHAEVLAHQQSSITLQTQYALAQRFALRPLQAALGLDRARLCSSDAEPLGREVLDFFLSLDVVLLERYGQLEATGPISVSTPSAVKLGALGRPMPGVELRIADDGEIVIRGGNVCAGYLNDTAATAALLEGGWLHTGDLGALDADGFLTLTGRKARAHEMQTAAQVS